MLGAVGNLLIALFGLFFIGGLIFMAIEYVATDERFKKIAKFAVGGVLVLLFLYDAVGVLTGSGGAVAITPVALLWFAISVICILLIWYIINWFLDKIVTSWFPAVGGFMEMIKFVIGVLVLLAILVAAADLLVGGGGRIFNAGTSRGDPPAQNRDLLGR